LLQALPYDVTARLGTIRFARRFTLRIAFRNAALAWRLVIYKYRLVKIGHRQVQRADTIDHAFSSTKTIVAALRRLILA